VATLKITEAFEGMQASQVILTTLHFCTKFFVWMKGSEMSVINILTPLTFKLLNLYSSF
jgi:hypothetical protein